MKPQLIFIDNDELNRLTWKIWAETNNLRLVDYPNVEKFVENAQNIDRTTAIFLDYNLDDKKTAAQYLPELNALGFKNIIIATGETEIESDNIEGIVAVIGKDPEEALSYLSKDKIHDQN